MKKRRKNIYLGRRVKDRGKRGLDRLSEVEEICKAILSDYRNKRISYRKAMARLTFLETTVIPRNKKLKGKKRKALAIVQKYKNKLRIMRIK